MDDNKDAVQGVMNGNAQAEKPKGFFNAILEPGDRTPEKNRILFMCLALFVAAVAVITLIGIFQ
jgi:hypothetical protein